MEYIQSNSTSTGMMSVNTTFKVGTNVDVATLDVQNRVGIAKPFAAINCKPFRAYCQGKKYNPANDGSPLFPKGHT
jgi:hypothetical protein